MQKGPNDYRREGLATMDYIKKLSAIYSRQNLINLWKTALYLLVQLPIIITCVLGHLLPLQYKRAVSCLGGTKQTPSLTLSDHN